jgi:hypothetical protein
MTQGDYAVLLVRSTGHAYQMEKVLKKAGIACRLVPVPRQLSSDCGVCVRIDAGSLAQALLVLEDSGAAAESAHEI